jgi:hypothetical protein
MTSNPASLNYVTVGTNNAAVARTFYAALMAELNGSLILVGRGL